MGIYDRDYYREEAKPLFQVRAPTRMLTTIIIINVVVFIADAISPPILVTHPLTHQEKVVGRWLSDHLAAQPDSLVKPWLWWQLLTYGFVHSPTDLTHILFNMLSLFFLGRVVEDLYGKWEFLRLYLVMLVAGSVAWAAGNLLLSQGNPAVQPHLIGASGAVTGVIVLMILNFPNQTLILFPIPIPIRAWVLGVFIIAINIFGFTGQFGGNVAYGVHLVGAGFAFVYYYYRWNLGRAFSRVFGFVNLRRPRRRFRVHYPDREEQQERELSEKVDQILEKIHREGEEKLTRRERRILNNASQQYQKKHR